MRWCVALTNLVNRVFDRFGARLKVKLVSASVALGLVALVLSGTNWIEASWEGLGVGPSGQMQTTFFAGTEAYGYLLPLLLVYFAGLFLVSISSGRLRVFGAVVTFSSIVGIVLLWTQDLRDHDITAIAETLENSSGISGPALVDSLDITFLSMATFSGIFYVLMSLAAFALVLAGKRLDIKGRKVRRQASNSKKTNQDPISMWDNQR